MMAIMVENTEVIDAVEAAEFLGAHVETIRRLARRGEIPSFKVGKDWRFRRDILQKWSETQRSGIRNPLVLTVDDEPVVCQTISRIVQRLGYRTMSAGGGLEGLLAVAREVPGLILLDLVMPEMTGAEFLKTLRASHPDLPVAIITGYPESGLIAEAMKYGPLLILSKPVDEAHLQSLLQMTLGEGTAVLRR
jgi:excisionase family DNA binding protein